MEETNTYTDILQDIAEDDELADAVNQDEDLNQVFIGPKHQNNFVASLKRNLPDILAIGFGVTLLSLCWIATKKTSKVNPFDAAKYAEATKEVIETTAEVVETVA